MTKETNQQNLPGVGDGLHQILSDLALASACTLPTTEKDPISGIPPPPVLYQRLKSGGGVVCFSCFFDRFEQRFAAARLLAPYTLVGDIGKKHAWTTKKSGFFLPRGAIWRKKGGNKTP